MSENEKSIESVVSMWYTVIVKKRKEGKTMLDGFRSFFDGIADIVASFFVRILYFFSGQL